MAASATFPRRAEGLGPTGGEGWHPLAANDQYRRLAWLDAVKGLGIVLVVVGHVMDGLFSAGILERSGLARLVFHSIYIFHMPLFFFASGITSEISLRKGRSGFLLNRVWTVAYPYLLWSTLQGSVQVIMSDHLNRSTSPENVLGMIHSPIGHFWFLYALFFHHLCAALLDRRRALLIAVALAGLVAHRFADGVWSPMAYYFVFYAAGLTAGRRAMAWASGADRRTGAALVVAWWAVAVICGALTGWSYVGATALPVSAAGVLAAVWVGKTLRGRALRLAAALGTMSMTIYVLHVTAAAGARVALLALGVPREPAVFVAVGTVAGLVGPIVVHLVLRRQGWLAALGLAAPRCRRPVWLRAR